MEKTNIERHRSWASASAGQTKGIVVAQWFAAVLFLGLTMFSFHASAQSFTAYSGAGCLSFRGQTFDNMLRGSNGDIVNVSSTNNAQVVCPVANLSINGSGSPFSAVYVENYGGTMTCTLYSTNVDGTPASSQTKSTTGSGYQPLYFNGPTTSAGWGNWIYYCFLPPLSRIYEYVVQLN